MHLFHAHLTLDQGITEEEVPRGWKSTKIFLKAKDRLQVDSMLTKHYCIGVKVNHVVDILRDAVNTSESLLLHKVLRTKIEQDSGFSKPITPQHYVEAMYC